MSENKFDFTYDEAETVDRLIALNNTGNTMTELIMKHKVVTGDYLMEIAKARSVVSEMQVDLGAYASDKHYDLSSYSDALEKSKMELSQNPFKQEYDRITKAEYEETSAFVRSLRSKDVEIDESQFEVPDQNQKTL